MLEVKKYLLEIIDLIESNLDKIESLRYENVKYKEDDTPVTFADVFVENLIGKYLKDKFCSINFISEENYSSTTDIFENKYIAILDPIDGTENFNSGLPEWGISIGFWENMIFRGGMIYLPELNLKIISGDKMVYKTSRIVGLSSSISQEVIDEIKIDKQYRIMGSAVYNIYNVITGAYSRFINPKGMFVWDFYPGIMLALEHGCEVIVNGEKYVGQFLNPKEQYKVEIFR